MYIITCFIKHNINLKSYSDLLVHISTPLKRVLRKIQIFDAAEIDSASEIAVPIFYVLEIVCPFRRSPVGQGEEGVRGGD